MNTIIPIIIPVNGGGRRVDPTCPHCKETLEGYSAPSATSNLAVIGTIILVCFVLLQIFSCVMGAFDGSQSACNQFGDKRYDYAIPAYTLSCQAERWITNEEFITKVQRKAYYEELYR